MSVIKVENLSKKYIIGHDRAANRAYHYYSLRESLTHHARGIYQRLRHPLTPNRENTELEEFWALKDINFEIKQGDRVGIIGRNGAGKSTLLKILSRITEPTTGKITMHGRVASLLEVGTGFHPELTGRENIYLNGAILGMSRLEIKKKFDEIVAFAEVEKFLDTPVKHYSSGMYVRLAFAVAAHLEPEILLVDEVLAVGDAEFQKKCLGKMEDVSKEGRTVLFVSHSMPTITSLCNKAILLKSGTVDISGETFKVVEKYSLNTAGGTYYSFQDEKNKFSDIYLELVDSWIDGQSNKKGLFSLDDEIHIKIRFIIKKDNDYITIPVCNLFLVDGTCALASSGTVCRNFKPGVYMAECVIPAHFLNNNTYVIAIGINSSKRGNYIHHYYNTSTMVFTIADNMGPDSERYGYIKPYAGVVHPLLKWNYKNSFLD
ncbi:MAG: polysaccharide ABC transporter ATP-binding protein [Victivallales bacterium]|nr:polysaccharide ABC transporter ATP-binding protein [Victivallales bacterium]